MQLACPSFGPVFRFVDAQVEGGLQRGEGVTDDSKSCPIRLGVVMHNFNPNTQEAEASSFMN